MSEQMTVTPEPRSIARRDVLDEDGNTLSFAGALLGEASGRRARHSHALGQIGDVKRCSACRWTEARVYRVYDEPVTVFSPTKPDGFVVEVVGRTIIDDETDRHSAWRVSSPHSVVELLNSSRSSTLAARLALAEAAGNDPTLEEAYINRVD